MEVNKAMNNMNMNNSMWKYWPKKKLFIIEERAVLSIDGKVCSGGINCLLDVSHACPTIGKLS